MKVALFVVVLTILSYIVSAEVPLSKVVARQQLADNSVPKDVLQFVTGFALAIDSKVGNLPVCLKTVNITMTQFHTAVDKLTAGLKAMNVPMLLDSFSYFAVGLAEVQQALAACGEKKLIEDIRDITYDLQSGSGHVVKVIVKELVNIFVHKGEVVSDFQKFASSWNAKQWTAAGVHAGKITVMLIEGVHEQQPTTTKAL
ncbi:hypothetical protein AKO1_013314 [Acrasis kona]|uniref:Uncharacterized protein n=1 Tax=Acrasis kona TaxID=1008807 RepID=A0AAW2Z0R5_9EUKA